MYSKLVSIEIFNFMCYKHAKVLFDETGIINLKGYNDNGKSTIEKALMVCLADMFSRSQSKLIRYGEDYFRIVVEFDDGVSILRDKYINGQSLYEMWKDGKLLFTTKQGNKLTKISGVPETIATYVGLCTLDTGCLNYQSRDDKLWLIDTTGSENYYSINEALKAEELARASALINSDKNALNTEISELEAELQSAQLQLAECSEITEDFVISLSERDSYAKDLAVREDAILRIEEELEELGKIVVPPVLNRVNVERYESLERVGEIVERLQTVGKEVVGGVIPKVDEVSVNKLSSLTKINELRGQLNEVASKKVVAPVSQVETTRVEVLRKVQYILLKLNDILKKEKAVKVELKNVSGAMKKAVEEARKNGYVLVQCDNCGTYMEVGVNNEG